MTKKTCVALWGLALCASVSAQAVYRCGPDGRELSQMPCSGGQKVELRANPPTPADERAAREVAERDARLAREMRQEREHQPAPGGAISLSGPVKSAQAHEAHKPRKASRKPKSRCDEIDVCAVDPASLRKPKKKGQA
jgi:hypothetical protein